LFVFFIYKTFFNKKFTSNFNYTNYLISKVEQIKKYYELMILIINKKNAKKLIIIIHIMFKNLELVKKYKKFIEIIIYIFWKEINMN
jgi:hypothetical protein